MRDFNVSQEILLRGFDRNSLKRFYLYFSNSLKRTGQADLLSWIWSQTKRIFRCAFFSCKRKTSFSLFLLQESHYFSCERIFSREILSFSWEILSSGEILQRIWALERIPLRILFRFFEKSNIILLKGYFMVFTLKNPFKRIFFIFDSLERFFRFSQENVLWLESFFLAFPFKRVFPLILRREW